MRKYLILLFIPALVFGFGSGTVKQIDEIKNNTGTDILLNPTDKVDINYFTGSKALQSTVDGELEESGVTNTELGYLSGVTSAIQDQIDSKTPLTRNVDTTAPLQGGGTLEADRTLSILQSGVAQDGYLSSTDWNTFNDKQDALTFGDLTESTSSVLNITGGTGAVIGSGASIQVNQASAIQDGYISSTDFATFNNKQDAITGTDGDLYYWNSGLSSLGIGTNGQILSVSALGFPEWIDLPPAVSVTTKGDLQTYSTSPDRLPVGTSGQVLSANSATSTGLEWIDPNFYSSPLTTDGDILFYNTTEQRLGIGGEGQLLTVSSGLPSWQDAPISLPDQTGNNGLYLKTNGTTASWNEVNVDVNEIKDNFLECSGFDACAPEGTITNGAGIDFSGTTTRTTETTAFNTTKLNLSQSAAGTLDYTYTKSGSYDGKQLVAYCEAKTDKAGVYFSAGSDSVEAGKLELSSDNTWKYYKIPFIGGATDQYFKVEHTDVGTIPNIDIDNCFIGKSSTIQQFEYTENIGFRAGDTSGQTVADGDVIIFGTEYYDNGGDNYNPSTGIYTVPISGVYHINARVRIGQSVAYLIGVNINGSNVSRSYEADTTTSTLDIQEKLELNAGDTISINNVTGGARTFNGSVRYNFFSVQLMSKSQSTVVTQDTETLWGKYYLNTTQTINGGTNETIVFDTKFSGKEGGNLDNFYDTSTGILTNTGKERCFEVSANILLISVSANARSFLMVLKNGSIARYSSDTLGATVTNPMHSISSGTICLKDGETLSIAANTGDVNNRDIVASQVNNISIREINNSKTIVGKFENINSSDLHFVEAEITGTPSVVNSTFTTMLFTEKKDTGNIYDPSTGIITFTKSGTYDVKSQIFFGTFSATATIQIDIMLNGSTVAQNQCLTHTTNFNWICAVNRSIDVSAGDTLSVRVWQNSGATRTVSTNFRSFLSIDEQPDYEAIVKNLSDQKVECQVKILSANVTSGATNMPDLTFTNLDSTKKYEAYLHWSANSCGAVVKINGANYGQVASGSGLTTVTGSTFDFSNPAGDLTFDTTGACTAAFGTFAPSGERGQTWVRLCELPDTYVETTKF